MDVKETRHAPEWVIWVSMVALVCVVVGGGFGVHWWQHRDDEARARAEEKVVELVEASGHPALATATHHQIVTNAYGTCPDDGSDDWNGVTLGGQDGPDEDPVAAGLDSLPLPTSPQSASLQEWYRIVAAAAKQAGLCQYK